MMRNIEFDCSTNYFQQILKSDLDKIHVSDKMLAFADKTTNLHEIDSEYYRKLHNNITRT